MLFHELGIGRLSTIWTESLSSKTRINAVAMASSPKMLPKSSKILFKIQYLRKIGQESQERRSFTAAVYICQAEKISN